MSAWTYKTIGLIIDHLLATRSWEQLNHFLELRGVPIGMLTQQTFSSKLGMLRTVLKELVNDDQTAIIREIVEVSYAEMDWAKKENLEAALNADGFTITDGKLQAGSVALSKERSALEVLIERNAVLTKDVLLHHLNQIHELYSDGKWDASIGQGRNFIEQLLKDIAVHRAMVRKEKPDLSKPVLVREYLVHSHFLEDHERKRLIDGVYGYLSEEGSHPGISDQRISYICRVICLMIGQYLAEKMEHLPSAK
jgi:hypothetical protein